MAAPAADTADGTDCKRPALHVQGTYPGGLSTFCPTNDWSNSLKCLRERAGRAAAARFWRKGRCGASARPSSVLLASVCSCVQAQRRRTRS